MDGMLSGDEQQRLCGPWTTAQASRHGSSRRSRRPILQIKAKMEVNFLDRFHIQPDGTIFYRARGGRWKLKKLQVNRDGYYILLLGKGKSMMAHRAVAMVYVSNPESKPEVNHLDSNRKNNAWWNLEWVTAMENTDHAILAGGKQKRNPVCGVKDDGTGLWLRSLTEARWHGFDESSLWKCLKGRQRVHKGFTWHRP